jgi:hypothetical protein
MGNLSAAILGYGDWPLPSIEFRDQTIATSDLTIDFSTFTAVSFVGCQSKEWFEIGEQLATLP